MTKKRQEAVQTERTLVEQTAIEQPKAVNAPYPVPFLSFEKLR